MKKIIDAINKNEWKLINFTFFLIVIVAFCIGGSVAGPFIFADEAEYHWLASEIFHSQNFYGRQYNPLYPLLISPTFYFDNLAVQYHAIRLINIVAYTSIIFPAYLIAKKLLTDKPLAILFAIVATLGPIGAYSNVIWADPLYYTLICWSYYFLVRYLAHANNKDIFIAGLFIGLGFLAKQAALFLLISCYLYAGYALRAGGRKFDKKAIGLITIGAALFVLPWMVRNALFEKSVVGYSSMFTLFIEALKTDPLHFMSQFLGGIGSSLGYWIFIYFAGGFFLLLFTAFQDEKRLEGTATVASPLAKLMLVQATMLMLVSELFLAAYGKGQSANGRYVDVIYPMAIIVIAWAVLGLKKIKLSIVAGAALTCFALLFVFSPFTQVESYGVVNNSGVSILNFLWPDKFIWQRLTPSLDERVALAAALAFLLVWILVFRKKAIWLVCLYSIALGVGAELQAVRLGETSNPANELFMELSKRNIHGKVLALDEALKDSAIPYHLRFWNPTDYSETKFVDPIGVMGKISIDFGRQEISAPSGTWKIWAPWNPESGYREQWGSGFSDITTLNAAKCPDQQDAGDFVFDRKPLVFYYPLQAGNYVLTGKSGDPECLGVKSDFKAQIQDGNSLMLQGSNEFSMPFEVHQGERGLKLSLEPSTGAAWALDKISIEHDSKITGLGNDQQYILSTKLLPLSLVFEVSGYRLYATRHMLCRDQ